VSRFIHLFLQLYNHKSGLVGYLDLTLMGDLLRVSLFIAMHSQVVVEIEILSAK